MMRLYPEGMDFPIPREFWWSTDILSSSIFLQGVDQEILDCVKINPSLPMMREWDMGRGLRSCQIGENATTSFFISMLKKWSVV